MSAGARWLRDLRVVDFSTGIAGAYCTKLFADAGAAVWKVEPPGGDPLRRWSASGADLGGEDGALFRFLHAGKRSRVGRPDDPELRALARDADLVVESFGSGGPDLTSLREEAPALVVTSLSPWGRTGPFAARPATEFIVQAECGSIGARGLPGGVPYQAGGRTTLWMGGAYAAAASLAALWGARRSGRGEHVDVSLLEVMQVAGTLFMDTLWSLLGRPELPGPSWSIETPSIEPTRDGYVGFCTNATQMFEDFLLLIGRPELREDRSFHTIPARLARYAEWSGLIHAYTRAHTTDEVLEAASLLRIPVAPVLNAASVRENAHLRERRVFEKDPSGGFVRPRAPYRIGDARPGPAGPAPALDEAADAAPARRAGGAASGGVRADGAVTRLPFEGLRIVDATAWWAGPAATHLFAALGADVIHLESIQRPDGMRMVGAGIPHPQWWECGHFYLATNTNKRGLTLDLARPEGRELALRLVERADALVENFTPRVMDGFGLDWEAVHARSPRCIYVRMPAFGLDGPWRDHPGFAQTMEQVAGLAWLTGHEDDQPRIQRGPCDPLAGMHAAFALGVALHAREETGLGSLVECVNVEGALNVAAEAIVEHSAYGALLARAGNRSPDAAPQGLYACAGHAPETPRWLALSVATDAQWDALVGVLGRPGFARDAALREAAERHARHDALDAALAPLFAARPLEAWVEALVAAGVPAAPVRDPRWMARHPQLRERGLFEELEHPVAGRHPLPGLPLRFGSVPRWLHAAAPTLGQHNREILAELGLAEPEIRRLEESGVIGSRPLGVSEA